MNVPNASRVNSRTALITGASSGIGEAFAEVFAAHGFDLVITARREDRLRAVAARLEERYGIRVLVFVADHARQDTAERLCTELAARGLTIDALVNNAGYGVPGTFVASPWQRHQDMLQVMVVGLAELTHRLLPGMIDRGYGRIRSRQIRRTPARAVVADPIDARDQIDCRGAIRRERDAGRCGLTACGEERERDGEARADASGFVGSHGDLHPRVAQ